MKSTTKLAAKRLRSPAASSTSVPFDLLASTNQESMLFHELDNFFSEPVIARRALGVARAAKEELGETDPIAPGERFTLTKQAFRCYQKSMRIILAEYLEHDGRNINISAQVLAHAAQGEHEEGGRDEGQTGACMTTAYVLASESFESFVELMHRLDSCSAGNGGRAQTKRSPDPFGDGAREGRPRTGRGSCAVAGDHPSSQSTGDPARKGAELFSKAKRETAQQPKNCGPSPPHRNSQIGGTGRRRGDNPCLLAERSHSAVSPPSSSSKETDAVDRPAATASSSCPPSRHQTPLVAPSSRRRCKRAEGDGCPMKDSRRSWRGLDGELPGEEAEGGGRNWFHMRDQAALSRRVVPPPPPARPAVERPVGGRSSEILSVEHDRGGAKLVSHFRRETTGAGFDGRRLHARGWFVETDSADWINVPAESTTGDFSGAGEDPMDMSGTFGTENAVASPRHLLDESKGDFTLDSTSTKKSNDTLSASHEFVDNFHFSSSKWNAEPYDCKSYSGFSDGDDDIDDNDGGSTGSEEFFPEPDPFDPTDGGLPCLRGLCIT